MLNRCQIILAPVFFWSVIPRLNTIEQCYLDTSKRYMDKTEEFENAIADISVMKRAIQKNSEDIRGLQLKQA